MGEATARVVALEHEHALHVFLEVQGEIAAVQAAAADLHERPGVAAVPPEIAEEIRGIHASLLADMRRAML